MVLLRHLPCRNGVGRIVVKSLSNSRLPLKPRQFCIFLHSRSLIATSSTVALPNFSLGPRGPTKCLQSFLCHQFHSSLPRLETVSFKLSDIGEGIQEVQVKEWFVKEGDKVNQFDQICEVQSDKASVTITSRYDGVVRKLYYKIDDIALVGSPLVDIELGEAETRTSVEKPEEVQERDAIQVGTTDDHIQLPTVGDKALATPAVRRIATENKVDLREVQGTGKDGRILKEDVINYINAKKGGAPQVKPQAAQIQQVTSRPAAPTPTIMPQQIIAPPKYEPMPDRKEAVKGFTKTMIKTMTIANAIPHSGYCDEIDVTNLINLRSHLKMAADIYGIKLTYMPFFIKAVSLALSSYPIINSSLDLASETITYKGSHNIGVAMDTKLGLVVPNVKNVQSKSILDVASELQRLSQCGIQGSFRPEDLSGGTFTLSNIGSIGGTYAKPVILPPEVAIGALGKVMMLPRFDNSGNVTKAHILYASFSADHRVIDGATMARFCNLWKTHLENPSSMLLHLK